MYFNCCKSNYCFNLHNNFLKICQNILWFSKVKWQILYQQRNFLPIFQLMHLRFCANISYFLLRKLLYCYIIIIKCHLF
jgi:hypothetical protein